MYRNLKNADKKFGKYNFKECLKKREKLFYTYEPLCHTCNINVIRNETWTFTEMNYCLLSLFCGIKKKSHEALIKPLFTYYNGRRVIN